MNVFYVKHVQHLALGHVYELYNRWRGTFYLDS
jgi:hypothetical protein